ncbi:MAG: hypothetical protein RDU20_19150 [Desulfomonilaceae bacterium]|nr:hypothetical protein [Desulfomonilaceae bacterium]
MTITEWKDRCPTLAEAFGADPEVAARVAPMGDAITSAEGHRDTVAVRSEKCASLVQQDNPGWLAAKASQFKRERDPRNRSAILGEVRAYGELLWVWQSEHVNALSGAGPDFRVNAGDAELQIEVNTPQGRSDKARTTRQLGTTTQDNVTITSSEIAPFGLPRHDRPLDTLQSECISKIAAIKMKEHQFDRQSSSVLWLDFNDLLLWPTGFDSYQALPVYFWKDTLTAGCLWNAFYAEKGDPIFDDLNVTNGHPSRTYKMEYPGRFNAESKIDLVICDLGGDKIVFQNHNSVKLVSDWVFRYLFTLFGFNLTLSWIDWPHRGTLKSRITTARRQLSLYLRCFRMD